MNFPNEITIKEVGPRDGLQNEIQMVPTDAKIKWINLLSETGITYIEVSSFVRPDWIPQLKDAREVAKRIKRKAGVIYAGLVPNLIGLERALEVDIDEICLFISASETHNRKNINRSIAHTYPILEAVANEAKANKKLVRGYVSTVFGCPYEGEIELEKVVTICDKLFSMGVDELSIGDTIGISDPVQVEKVVSKLLHYFPADKMTMHFHNTRGAALANVLMAMNLGIKNFDSAVGGIGGCPYAKGASGNLATEDLLYMIHRMGIKTGIDEQKVMKAALFIENHVHNFASHQMRIVKGKH